VLRCRGSRWRRKRNGWRRSHRAAAVVVGSIGGADVPVSALAGSLFGDSDFCASPFIGSALIGSDFVSGFASGRASFLARRSSPMRPCRYRSSD